MKEKITGPIQAPQKGIMVTYHAGKGPANESLPDGSQSITAMVTGTYGGKVEYQTMVDLKIMPEGKPSIDKVGVVHKSELKNSDHEYWTWIGEEEMDEEALSSDPNSEIKGTQESTEEEDPNAEII